LEHAPAARQSELQEEYGRKKEVAMNIKLFKPLVIVGSLALVLSASLSSGSAQGKNGGTFIVVRNNQWGANNLNPFLPGDQHL
jgi:hypothetical protein